MGLWSKFQDIFSGLSTKDKITPSTSVSAPGKSGKGSQQQTRKTTDKVDTIIKPHEREWGKLVKDSLNRQQERSWNFFMEKIQKQVEKIPEWEGKDFILSENGEIKKFSHIKYRQVGMVTIWFQDRTSLQPQRANSLGRCDNLRRLIRTLPLGPEDDPGLRVSPSQSSSVPEPVGKDLVSKESVTRPLPILPESLKPTVELEVIQPRQISEEREKIRQQQEQSWSYLFSRIQAGDMVSDWENKQFVLTGGTTQTLKKISLESDKMCFQFFNGMQIFADLTNLEGLKKQIMRLPEVPGEIAVPLSLEDLSSVESGLPIIDQLETDSFNLGVTQPIEPVLPLENSSSDGLQGECMGEITPLELIELPEEMETSASDSDSSIVPDNSNPSGVTSIETSSALNSEIEGVMSETIDRVLGNSSSVQKADLPTVDTLEPAEQISTPVMATPGSSSTQEVEVPEAVALESSNTRSIPPSFRADHNESIWKKRGMYATLASSILLGGLGVGYYAHSKKKTQSNNTNPAPQVTTHIPEKKANTVSTDVTSYQASQASSQATLSVTPKSVLSPAEANLSSQAQEKKTNTSAHTVTIPVAPSARTASQSPKPMTSDSKKSETLPSQVQKSIDTLGANVIYKQIKKGDTIWGMLKENNLLGSVWGRWQTSTAVIRARDGKITTPVDDTLARRLQIGDYLVIIAKPTQDNQQISSQDNTLDTSVNERAQINQYRLQDRSQETANFDRKSYSMIANTSQDEGHSSNHTTKNPIIQDLKPTQATVFVDTEGVSSVVAKSAHTEDSVVDRTQKESEQFLQDMIQQKQECKEWSGKKIILTQGGKELIFEKLSYVGDVARMKVHTVDNPGTSFYIRANEPMLSLPATPIVREKNMDQFAAFADRLQKVSDNRIASREKQSFWGKVKSWFA